jgi:signal transduction histidine kinase
MMTSVILPSALSILNTSERESFNLGELVQDVIRKFHLAAGEKGIPTVTNIQEPLLFVNADIGLVERAIENLLENAVHYIPECGSVSLTIQVSGAPGKGTRFTFRLPKHHPTV